MADKTGIEWTDATWNPVTGCTEVSPGCDHCYAETFAERWRGTSDHYFEHGFDVQLRPDKLDLPLRWRKPRRIFVNSMSDLFHDQVPDEYIARVWAVMASAPQHTFQVLTKRHGRMRSLLTSVEWQHKLEVQRHNLCAERIDDYHSGRIPVSWTWPLPNVWLGVSTEDQQWADIRIPALLETPAAVRFVSAEPLLGPIVMRHEWLQPTFGCTLWTDTPTAEDKSALLVIGRAAVRHLGGAFIDWVIVGGESGHGARAMHPAWARNLRNQCFEAEVPYLFKQWGNWRPANSTDQWQSLDWVPREPGNISGPTLAMARVGKKAAGRQLDGRTWDQYPQAAAHV